MFKNLSKKALSIIMASMLVASVCAMSACSGETDVKENSTAVQDSETKESDTYTYIDKDSGVKVESKGMVLTEINVSIAEYSDRLGRYEEQYSVELFDDEGDYLSLEDVPVTLYLPCEKENCYVVMDEGSNNLVQLEAEFVEGYYKFDMPNFAMFTICSYPLTENDAEIVQQTLVDEKTGVSVSGMIQSGSALAVKDVKELYKEIIEEEGFEIGIIHGERPAALGEKFDGYNVRFVKNLVEANTDGNLTVTLPFPEDGYEVRCINRYELFSSEDADEAQRLQEDMAYNWSIPAEEVAKNITALVDKVYPPLETEYVDGSYVVKNGSVGYYVILPKGSFVVTAEDVEKERQIYDELENDDNFHEAEIEASNETNSLNKDTY